MAREFHDRYEEIAHLYGYKTREDTKDFDPESPNGQLMQAVCLQVVGPIIARLQAIATMPEYDQDDAHRLRGMARRFLDVELFDPVLDELECSTVAFVIDAENCPTVDDQGTGTEWA